MCDTITKTRFINISISNTPDKGISIGEGECKGVRLMLNPFQRNTETPNSPTGTYFAYYGDAQSQDCQLIAYAKAPTSNNVTYNMHWSEIIPCTDLSQVFIRYFALQGWPTEAIVSVMILI